MIAHNRQSLDNRDMQEQSAQALAKGIITEAEYHRIRETHPVELYNPNIFVRIGLFLLTVLITACALGLSLMLGMSSDRGMAITMIVWGGVAYGALELFILNKSLYRAGVDDALLWMATVLVFTGIQFLHYEIPATVESGIVLILATWGVLRYADRLMALLAYGALISLIFYLLNSNDRPTMAITPFVVMAVSVIAYLLFTRQHTSESLRHYHSCLSGMRMAALLSLYLAGNYYVVQHLNTSASNAREFGGSGAVTLSWLWWILTLIVPVAYIAWGIRKKDTILLWSGLGLVAVTIFTVRYYYQLLPVELEMIISGGILIIGAYALIRYLNPPKHGFTSAKSDEDEPHVLESLPVEGLILAETLKSIPSQPIDQPGRFGGGSGGGAGAGGTY